MKCCICKETEDIYEVHQSYLCLKCIDIGVRTVLAEEEADRVKKDTEIKKKHPEYLGRT